MIFPQVTITLAVLLSARGVVSYQAEVAEALTSFLESGDDEILNSSSEAALLFSQFQSWADEHEKEYKTNDERAKRLMVWAENHEFIEKHNNQTPKPSYELGHNQFSDLSSDEFQQMNFLGDYFPGLDEKAAAQAKFGGGEESAESIQRELLAETSDLPSSVDWVKEGAVTEVKNQGHCGACWAFSTTGALEGAKFLKTGELVSLSEQNLLDCDQSEKGCKGGLMQKAFVWDETSGGICSEADYHYVAKKNDQCGNGCTPVLGTAVKGFVDIPQKDPKALMAALAVQPVSIAMQANQLFFQFYKTGVFDNVKCGEKGKVDHGVLAVGYGTEVDASGNEKPFWLVKNSWGPRWGDKGFFKVSRDFSEGSLTNPYGVCSLYRLPSVPVLA